MRTVLPMGPAGWFVTASQRGPGAQRSSPSWRRLICRAAARRPGPRVRSRRPAVLRWRCMSSMPSKGSRARMRIAADVQHEMRTVVEEDVDVPWSEIHGAYPRRRATEVMAGGIPRWIRFGFDDASAEAASRKVMDYNFADEEARESDGVMRKFGSMQTTHRELLRWGSLTAAR